MWTLAFKNKCTRFENYMSAYSMHQVFSAIRWSVWGLPIYREIRTFSIIFAKPVLIADTVLIWALPSFLSFWLFPMSMLSFSPNCWSRAWASQGLVPPCTPQLLQNAPQGSCMMCVIRGMWFLNAGHSIREARRVDWSLRAIEQSEKVWFVVVPSKRPSVS